MDAVPAADRPVIAVTGSYHEGEQPEHAVRHAYVRAVRDAGGMPVLVPALAGPEVVAAILELADGLLLTGGVDLDPAWFGEPPHPRLGRVSPQRDALEVPLTRAALDADLPLLAVCRGLQVLNVAAGGTLIQDLESQVPGAIQHQQRAPFDYPMHEVEVEADTRLLAVVDSARLRVNSRHHQAVRDPAPGFAVTARAPDGVVEALEKPGAGFVLGVQWHPEDLAPYDAAHRALFRALVEAAGRTRPRAPRRDVVAPPTRS